MIDAYNKTGMLHQLANELDQEIWWAQGQSIKDIKEYKKVRLKQNEKNNCGK